MDVLKDCPECGKQLVKTKKYCTCGWKIAEIKEHQEVNKYCGFLMPEGRCKKSEPLHRMDAAVNGIAIHTGMKR